MSNIRSTLPSIIITLMIALAGTAVFIAASLPLPWLLGPMFGCLVAALAGYRIKSAPYIGDAMRTVLGVAIGASITPALFDRIGDMLLTVALIPPFIVLLGVVGYPYFRRLCGFDKVTSFYAAMPGGFQDMLLFGEEAGGNVRALSLIHATRVMVIVSLMPFAMELIWRRELSTVSGAPIVDMAGVELLVMLAAAVFGWWGARAVGLFGAPILGPMIVATILSLTNVLHFRPPVEAITAAQFFIGIAIGEKYRGLTVEELRNVVVAGLGYTLITLVVSLGIVALVVRWGLAPEIEAVLAFAPGGQAEMVLLAIVAGADMAFVVTHHIVRVAIVILCAPMVFSRLR